MNVCEAALQAATKGGNFGAKLTHLCGFWLDVSFFLTREKTSFAILIGGIIFFTCENHRSLLLLARTNLRTKIYDIAFWWTFFSTYIINLVTTLLICSARAWASIVWAGKSDSRQQCTTRFSENVEVVEIDFRNFIILLIKRMSYNFRKSIMTWAFKLVF